MRGGVEAAAVAGVVGEKITEGGVDRREVDEEIVDLV